MSCTLDTNTAICNLETQIITEQNEIVTLQGLIPGYITQIQDAQAALSTILANPKPNYDIDGQQVGWGEYQNTLNNIIKGGQEAIESTERSINILLNQINLKINLLMRLQPYWFTSTGF